VLFRSHPHIAHLPLGAAMSLVGRRIIDNLKRKIGRYYILPVPPYGSIHYWEKVYKQLSPQDVFEWGQIHAEDLDPHDFRVIQFGGKPVNSAPTRTTSLGSALDINTQDSQTCTIVLGCGISTVGEELVRYHGWSGRISQVDFVNKVIEELKVKLQDLPNAEAILDDATTLSTFEDCSVDAVMDKGLIDTIFCADEYEKVDDIMKSVHRVLKPGGVFCVFSFSRPEFILPRMEKVDLQQFDRMWNAVEVRECFQKIIMYRFRKVAEDLSRLKKGRRKEGIKVPR